MNTVEKIMDVLSDEALQPQIAACISKEDALKLLREHGAEASEEEIRAAALQIQTVAAAEIGEVDEENLEKVSGGRFKFPIDWLLDWLLG